MSRAAVRFDKCVSFIFLITVFPVCFAFVCMFGLACNTRRHSLLSQFCTKTETMGRPFTVKSFALFRMAASKRRWMSWTPIQRCSAGKQSATVLSEVLCNLIFRCNWCSLMPCLPWVTKSSLNVNLPQLFSEVVFEKAYCEYRLNRVESSLKTIESAPEQTDKLKELYGQVVRLHVKPKATELHSLKRNVMLIA